MALGSKGSGALRTSAWPDGLGRGLALEGSGEPGRNFWLRNDMESEVRHEADKLGIIKTGDWRTVAVIQVGRWEPDLEHRQQEQEERHG